MLLYRRNKELSETCKRQGEKIFQLTRLIGEYDKKLTDIKEILRICNKSNAEAQIKIIKRIINN